MGVAAKLSELLGRTNHRSANKSGDRAPSFGQIMDIAKAVAAKNPAGLQPLVRALLRPIQAQHLVAVAERPLHAAPAQLQNINFFFPIFKVASSDDLYLRPRPEVRVSLAADIVLPTPWHRDRYIDTLTSIGTGNAAGPWTQDRNHCVSVWRPWNIAFVLGGNHSIATGILLGEGEVLADEVWDLAPVFDRVACDGRQYVDVRTGERIAKVMDPRRAAVFEIGRMIVTSGTIK